MDFPILIPIAVILGGAACALVWFVWRGKTGGKGPTSATGKRPGPAKLSLVAGKTDNIVLMTDREGVIEDVNDGFQRMTGYSPEEVIGEPFSAALLGTQHNARNVHRVREGMSTRKSFSVELFCVHKAGQRFWLLLTLTPIFDQQNFLIRFIGVGVDITGRKHTEEELLRLNRRNELFLNAAGEGIFGLDAEGRISFVNPAAARLTGWDTISLVGQPASTILFQLKLEKLPNTHDDHFTAAAFQDGVVTIGNLDLFRRQDGTHFPVDYTSTVLREGEQIVGSVVVFRDITDRKQIEMTRTQQGRQYGLRADVGFSLAASDNLRNILQRCTMAFVKHLDTTLARIWTLNTEENVLELQASAGLYTHIEGRDSRVPVGTMKIGMVAKERVPSVCHDLANDPHIIDAEWVKRERLMGFVGYPLFVENRLIGVLAVYSRDKLPGDILELMGSVADSIAQGIVRKRVEEKVLEQAALLDKAQDAIVVTDLSSRCIFWNKSAERLYGWPAREVHGKKIDQLFFKDSSNFDKTKQIILDRREWKGEVTHVTRGDETIVVESQWTLVQDNAGAPKSILIVNTDITERKKIEAQFLRTQRMESIGALAGGIAHDLNNVLAPIMMSVEMLKVKFPDAQSQRMLSVLESSTKRGADMVKQILTFARGVDGERILLQTKHLIREIAKIVGETFPKNIQLRTNIAENLWTVIGDATQLHQVLVNLAVNARDAMPQGGMLTIAAENTLVEVDKEDAAKTRPGFYVVIKVSDNGTGIPRDILDKIFEPFFTTKEVGKGTGLGLATVLSIVKNHGGFVQVQTELNKGTTFVIYLPAEQNAQNQPTEHHTNKLPTGKGELILAVDDEISVLTMTKETLENFGYRVLTAKDGTEAVAVFSAHRHEIKGVLTDMLMPYMDGPATVRVLRKLDPNVRVIAASGLMDSEKVKDSTGMDNISFLMKPYTTEKLLHAVHDVICA